MRIALVGQPNCGKSSLFNSVAGYKTVASNFPGTTIEYTSSRVRIKGETFELVDLPGVYSLSTPEREELVTRNYLLENRPDLVISILDTSVLSRSLELTLELLELKIPLVVCLNMIDEAKRKGIQVDLGHLSQDLGVPIIPTIATRGEGVPELFQTALETARNKKTGKTFYFSLDVEKTISEISSLIDDEVVVNLGSAPRFLAIKLLEQDGEFEDAVRKLKPEILRTIERLRQDLSECHGRPSDMVISSERHSLAMNLFEHVAKVKPRSKRDFREQVDRNVIMHPVVGYVALGLILFAFFGLVFTFGKHLEEPLIGWFDGLQKQLASHLRPGSLIYVILSGSIDGFSGGVGIVLPYLIPFLLGLAFLEDVGYLPRAAFLMDSIMHSIGLHGKSVIPFVLSYGCNVPSILGVRVLEKPRDRFITAILVTFIPCAARTTIIFALVAFYLGPSYALLLYVLNLVVIAGVGKGLSRMMPDVSPGMVLEIPTYKLPGAGAILRKVWFRLREFVVIAWPILIVGSLILSLLEYLHLSGPLNNLLSPFIANVLGLPKEVGITLIFGILRKELSIIMLVQALGTANFASVMTTEQMLVFTIFAMFYVPCLATLGVLRSTLDNRGMIFALVFNTAVGTVIALLFRLASWVV
jgi:ferrous iron transport protein B